MENTVSVSKLLPQLKATIRSVNSSGLNVSHGWAHGKIPFTHGGAKGEGQRMLCPEASGEQVRKEQRKENGENNSCPGIPAPAIFSTSQEGPAFWLSDSDALCFFPAGFNI